MKYLNDILKTINDAENNGIHNLGTQNVKRWIESVQKFEEKRNKDIVHILSYFEDGLSDVEIGSGEKQPMLKEIRNVLKKIKSNK